MLNRYFELVLGRIAVRRCGLSYRRSSVVCRFVTIARRAKAAKPDPDSAWVVDSGVPKKPCVRRESICPTARGNFEGKYGRPIVKYIGTFCR